MTPTHAMSFRYRLLPQVIAFGYDAISSVMYLWRPAWSYALNADFEDHAEHEYMAFVAEHPELEHGGCTCTVADDYGCADTFADVLRQIALDEREHKLESLAELGEAPRRGRPGVAAVAALLAAGLLIVLA